jgi:hypothetical protein
VVIAESSDCGQKRNRLQRWAVQRADHAPSNTTWAPEVPIPQAETELTRTLAHCGSGRVAGPAAKYGLLSWRPARASRRRRLPLAGSRSGRHLRKRRFRFGRSHLVDAAMSIAAPISRLSFDRRSTAARLRGQRDAVGSPGERFQARSADSNSAALYRRPTSRRLTCSASCPHCLPPFAGTQIACGSTAGPSSGRTR